VRDGVDNPADGQVVVGDLSDRVGVACADTGGVIIQIRLRLASWPVLTLWTKDWFQMSVRYWSGMPRLNAG
jgi:hypothetical protein